ncbi:MAG: SDR family NAD(P)-dependent oxidoreductase [Thalassobaculum sp.]|uniref:SDR family NAD(P)-dependent oxidoreductase n=1 Tax=Thalassobaculum sp. TaxID=2022740 RepID=UPI0032EE1767
MSHPVLDSRRAAVVTGAASGIGLAACLRFAELGMPVCLVDVSDEALKPALDRVAERTTAHGAQAVAIAADVSNAAEMDAAAATVEDRLGPVGVLMNNAVTRTGGGVWARPEDWRQALAVNFWGVLHGVNAFVPRMIEQGEPALVINCGSKQGITNPPGNAAYNVTKSAVKTYTEALQHELRNTEGCRVSAHLLVPGWTTTGDRPHAPGAWLPDQVVERMEASLRAGDFYIVCPDNEVTPEMDRARILWGAGDITENRPPLSRWHPDWKDAFAAFVPPE